MNNTEIFLIAMLGKMRAVVARVSWSP